MANQFCNSTAQNRSVDLVDLWVFLDSILDDSFQELETRIVFRAATKGNTKLIPTIVKRSPQLRTLKLNFKCIEYGNRENP